ncbi:unnamed protein product [Closterium sp. NIES-54]
MYALPTSADGACYLCVPPDPGIEPAALGAGESALSGTAPAEVLYTFTLDSGASRSFFRDSTTLTPLSRPVAVSLADPSGGPVLAHSSTVLPCLAVPSDSLLGLHLPSFSTDLVSGADLQDQRVDHFTPGGQRVTHCTVLPPLPPSPAPPYLPCVEGRQRAAPHSSSFPPTTAPLQTLHMDVWGPARVSGQDHERYFLLIRAARLQLREQFGTEFSDLRLHSDKGGEFSSNLLQSFCRGEGIRHTFTLPASPQQNGVAERRIGLVMEVARTSMVHAAAPHFLWPFAVRYAAHQLNLWPRVSLPETSPTLRWTGEVGDASVFRVWGARAFVRDTTADKLSARAVPCVFLGFVPNALDPLPAPGPAPSGVSQVDPPPLTVPVEVTGDSGPAKGGPARGAASGGAEPGGAEPGGAEPGGAEPGREEPGGAEPGGTESGGAAPGGTEASGEQSPWSGRLRSRSVNPKGYQQKEKVDYKELFAPVVKPTTLRTLLAGAAIKGWVVKQMDVTTAFLNGVLEEGIFMAQPEGFDDGSGRVLRLKKALYGLKQAPRQWYLKLRGVLEEIGFTPSSADHSLFMLGEGEQRSFMVVYVDDILIFSPSSDLVKEVMLKLQDKFKCKALGDVSFYLGLHIKRDVEKRCIRCVKGPEEESVGEEERRRFHSLVGSLMYAAVNTRPDVAFATGQLDRVVQCPNEEQVAAGIRVAKYLGQTPTVGLQYSAAAQRRQKGADGVEPGRLFLTAFSDASYASEPEEIKSVAGFICCVGGGPTAWESKKQVDQALGSVESEYMALFRAVREIVWQRRLLAELGEEQQGPTPLYCDSQGAISLAKNPVLRGLTKHMRVKWHWTRSMVATGEVELHYVKTTRHPADIMTKRLVEQQHWKHIQAYCDYNTCTGGTGAAGTGGPAGPGGAAIDSEVGGPGAGGAGSGGATAGGVGAGESGAAAGAGTGDSGAVGGAGTGGAGAGSSGATAGVGAGGSGAVGGAGAGGAGAGGSGAAASAGAGGAGATSAGVTAPPRLFFAPPSPSSLPPPGSVLHQVLSLPSSIGLPLQSGSPLPAPSPYTELRLTVLYLHARCRPHLQG